VDIWVADLLVAAVVIFTAIFWFILTDIVGIAKLHPLAIDVAVTPSETVLNLHTTIALVITLKALIALCIIVADSVSLKIDVLGRVSRLPRRLVTSAVVIVIIIVAVSRTSNKTAGDDTAIDTGEQSQEKE
jgi:hypothetical protein